MNLVAAAAGGMLPGSTIATHSLWLQYNSAGSLLVIVLATFGTHAVSRSSLTKKTQKKTP